MCPFCHDLCPVWEDCRQTGSTVREQMSRVVSLRFLLVPGYWTDWSLVEGTGESLVCLLVAPWSSFYRCPVAWVYKFQVLCYQRDWGSLTPSTQCWNTGEISSKHHRNTIDTPLKNNRITIETLSTPYWSTIHTPSKYHQCIIPPLWAHQWMINRTGTPLTHN